MSAANDLYCTFADVLNDTNFKNIFLKIDIDGSEYRFLDDLIANKNRLTGLVIELHDCDMHLREIENFIKNFGLKISTCSCK